MIRALYTAASGMSAQQAEPGHDGQQPGQLVDGWISQPQMQFQDMIYQNLVTPGAAASTVRRFRRDCRLGWARSRRQAK